MLRASDYVIYVDLPDNAEDVLLVHGYTGAYDRVSRRVANYLHSLEPRFSPTHTAGDQKAGLPTNQDVTSPSAETIQILKRRGYLTEKTAVEEAALFEKIVETIHDAATRQMPAYIFMPSYDCNLRCPYCYQDHMRTDPAFKHLLETTMQPELVDRLFAAMPKLEAHHHLPEDSQPFLNIGFYGGEPLLEKNRSIVEYIFKKALDRGQTNFSAVTNGTELHAYRDMLGPDKISSLQITLDGPPHEHDKRRIYVDDSPSFERIARNIDMALSLNVHLHIRMNIDRDNIHQLPELADEIIARGWDQEEKFSAYTSPISAANEKTAVKTTMSSHQLDKALTEMREQYPSLAVISRPDDNLEDRIWHIFDKQANPSFKASFCAAHNTMYVVDPFGDLYACWERTGDPNIRIGYITADGDVVLNVEQEKTWRSRNVTSNPACRQCRYALYCGGGCAARALNRYDELFTSYCDGFAARFRDSTASAYFRFIAGEKQVPKPAQVCES
ncbi:MAG TPA: radical SAM protein [Chloroflexi bacterium]|nr:radical SAM protein [Chloroflexota bacterium]